MKIVYTPEGVDSSDAHRWDWEPGKLLVPEVIEIEKATGSTFEEWVSQMERGSALGMRAFLWVMLRRETPNLGISSVVFTMSEISLDYTDQETRNIIAGMRHRLDSEPLNDEQVAQIEASIATLSAQLPDGGEGDADDDQDSADPDTVPGELVPADPKATGPKGRSRSASPRAKSTSS